jgi:transcriptional regulator with XRE-family HTH domain
MSDAAAADVDLERWGDNVREWRFERGLTQAQLALQAGVDQSTISRVEQGEQRPSDVQRIAISRVLRVPVGRLFPFPRDVR